MGCHARLPYSGWGCSPRERLRRHVRLHRQLNLEGVSNDAFETFLGTVETWKPTVDRKGRLEVRSIWRGVGLCMDDDGACATERPKELRKVMHKPWHPCCNQAIVTPRFMTLDNCLAGLFNT